MFFVPSADMSLFGLQARHDPEKLWLPLPTRPS